MTTAKRGFGVSISSLKQKFEYTKDLLSFQILQYIPRSQNVLLGVGQKFRRGEMNASNTYEKGLMGC